jgi:hypothetical protein
VRAHGAGDTVTVAIVEQVPLRTRVGWMWVQTITPPSAAKIAAERNRDRAQYGMFHTVCDFCPFEQ